LSQSTSHKQQFYNEIQIYVLISVGIKDPSVLKTDTHETENLDKAISFDQKDASMYLLQLSRHMNTKWQTVALSYMPDAFVPAPNPRFTQVKGSQYLSID
jgi:hypothetical protein